MDAKNPNLSPQRPVDSATGRATDRAVDQEVDPGRDFVLAMQGGDENAFEHLIEAYSERAYALFVRFTGQHEGAEDLVQELFLRVWRARDRYLPTARFSTWMYRIAFNLAANAGERRRNRASLSLQAIHGDESETQTQLEDEMIPQPSQGMERQDVVNRVQDAIASLPENQRMALILARYEDQSHQEVGDAIGISAKAVKSLIHRARETLRTLLADVIDEASSM